MFWNKKTTMKTRFSKYFGIIWIKTQEIPENDDGKPTVSSDKNFPKFI